MTQPRGRHRAPLVWLAALAAVTAAASVASAATAPSAVLGSNWWYDDPGKSATATVQRDTPTSVPSGDLGTGYRVGSGVPGAPASASETDKVAGYVFDLAAVRPGSSVTDFIITVPVDTTGDPSSAALVATSPPALVACLSARTFSPGKGPSLIAEAPPASCASSAPGVYKADTSAYVFQVAPIAQVWVDDVNTGLLVIPDPDPAKTPKTSYTLSLKTGPAVGVAASVTPPSAATPTAPASVGSGGEVTAPSTAPAPASSPSPTARPGPSSKAPSPRAAATSAAPAPVSPAAPAPSTITFGGGGSGPPPVALPGVLPAAPVFPVAAQPAAGASRPSLAASAPAADPAPLTGAAPAAVPVAQRSAADVRGAISPLAWVLLVLVILGLVTTLSLGLGTPVAAGNAGSSRLTRVLAGGMPSAP